MTVNEKNYTIPIWFISFATFIMVTLIPWAAWVTMQNIEMNVKQEFILERLQKIENRQEHRG